jgi:N-acetyl-anhydromuramyl-L-alanine amidase AmpD
MRIEVLKPFLVTKSRPTGKKVTTIVMHATAGASLDGAVSTLRERGLAYHYIIEKNGTIWKTAPYSAMASHAGNSYGPDEQKKGLSRKQNDVAKFTARCSVNAYTIGISFVNRDTGKDPFTAAQEAAARELITTLMAENPNLTWVTTHAIVSPKRKVDPNGFDIDGLARDVGLKVWRFSS